MVSDKFIRFNVLSLNPSSEQTLALINLVVCFANNDQMTSTHNGKVLSMVFFSAYIKVKLWYDFKFIAVTDAT